jgi:SAM-dependent methyltransferase
MPTSHYAQIGKVVEIMFLLRPQSVLDVGIGYGKYGFLAREYLELWLEHKPYDDRKIKIDGIEAFPAYINDGHRYYYDKIYEGNALDTLPVVGQYDLILLIDVLEHFSQEDGISLLKQCVAKGKHVLISTPLDIGDQGAVFGNEFERHRFQWERKHLRQFGSTTFFWNYHSILCLIGPDGKEIRRIASFSGLKLWLRSKFPGLYIFYRKHVRPSIVRE